MGVASNTSDPPEGGDEFRCVGSLTIARAASTQRELDAAPDPLTIDLSGVEKMDTVGAWLIYRAVRDRGAKVVGADKNVAGLLDQVAEADRPAQIRPNERSAPLRTLNELGEWVSEAGGNAGRTDRLPRIRAGCLCSDYPPPQAPQGQCRRPPLRPRRCARTRHHRPDDLPDRDRRWTAGRGPTRAVRSRGLYDQPDRADHGSGVGNADDRDHGRGPIRIGLRRANRHDEDHRGSRCDADHRRVAGRGAGRSRESWRRS